MFRVLSVTDILSKELQSESLDILHLFSKLEALIDCFKGERNDNSFKLLWIETEELRIKLSSKGFNVGNPTLQRRRKLPKKLDYSSSNWALFPESPEEYFEIEIYYAGLDVIHENLRQWFSENDYSKIKVIAKLLLNWTCVNEKKKKRYRDSKVLPAQPQSYATNQIFSQLRQEKFYKCILVLLLDVGNLFIQHKVQANALTVLELLEIALSWPITTASAERSFSTLRRLKTYLRSTMKEELLSGLALMTI